MRMKIRSPGHQLWAEMHESSSLADAHAVAPHLMVNEAQARRSDSSLLFALTPLTCVAGMSCCGYGLVTGTPRMKVFVCGCCDTG